MTLPLAALPGRLITLAALTAPAFLEAHNPGGLPVAGVLVPIIDRPGGATLLLTRRSATLSKHAGQIAFPGGRADASDADIIATALRETWEETGIAANLITPVGGLEPVESVTGFLMVPVVAVVRPEFTAVANPGEVDAIFEVPLDFVLDATNHVQKFMMIGGIRRDFYSIVYGVYDIWGATARILVNFSRRLADH